MTMKKILVTGASGFIGNYVVRQLLSSNFAVIATSSDAGKAKQRPWYNEVRYIPFNLQEFAPTEDYYSFFERPDHVIHLAWEGLPNYKSLFHIEENLPRHFSFIKNLVVHGCRDITVTGTCLEYGFREGALSEDMLAVPANPYAVAKDSLRKFLEELRKLHPFSLKWMRLFYMHGEGQSSKSLLSQLDKAVEDGASVFNMSGGEQVRDYLPVEEVASIVITAAMQEQVGGVINCCSGIPVTIKDFVQDYCKRKNITIQLNFGYYPYPDYEPMRFWGDTTKLKRLGL